MGTRLPWHSLLLLNTKLTFPSGILGQVSINNPDLDNEPGLTPSALQIVPWDFLWSGFLGLTSHSALFSSCPHHSCPPWCHLLLQAGSCALGTLEMAKVYFTLSVIPLKCPDKGQPAWTGTGKGSTSRSTEGGRTPGHHPGAWPCFAALFDIVVFVLFHFGSLFHLIFGLLGCCNSQSYRLILSEFPHFHY